MGNRAFQYDRGVEFLRGRARATRLGVWIPPVDTAARGPINATNHLRQTIADATPNAAQPFLTWLTAKPARDDVLRAHGPGYHLGTALLSVAAGLALSILALGEAGWWFLLLPIGLILTTSGMGKLQAVIYHHCAHKTVLARPEWNEWLGEAISILLLIKRFDTYRREHLQHHRASVQLTDEDEFLQFLQDRLGMRIGEPKAVLRRKMLWGLASPVFHMRCLWGRMTSCFRSDRRNWDIASAVAWIGLLSLVTYLGIWREFAVVWLVPLVVLFQIATSLRILCEHRFPATDASGNRGARFICEVTTGVVAGAPPPRTRTSGAWLLWWAEMLTVHLFCRVFVLVGDAPAHDHHHRHPQTGDWPNHIRSRQGDADSGGSKFPVNYVEYWGLFKAIDNILDTMSQYRPGGPVP